MDVGSVAFFSFPGSALFSRSQTPFCFLVPRLRFVFSFPDSALFSRSQAPLGNAFLWKLCFCFSRKRDNLWTLGVSRYTSSGVSPVSFATLASIFGSISSVSWKAKTKSACPCAAHHSLSTTNGRNYFCSRLILFRISLIWLCATKDAIAPRTTKKTPTLINNSIFNHPF